MSTEKYILQLIWEYVANSKLHTGRLTVNKIFILYENFVSFKNSSDGTFS
jgi:hypothetical protein